MKTTQLLAGLAAVVLLAGTPSFANGSDKNPNKVVAKTTTYTVDAEKSTVTWKGKKVTGEHYGPVKVEKGSLMANGSQLTGGTVSIDLRTIASTDLKDNKEYHDKLVGHLKADDFFGVEKYPTATFKITKVTPKGGNTADVTGDLTIKGITNPLTIPTTVKVSGNTLEATGTATVDRSKYNMRYNSKSFFDNLGDKMIYDEFTLDLNIIATAGNASTASKAK